MKVILKEDLESLGKRGDVIEVRRGYARNYLIPRRIAVLATKGSLKQLELEKRVLEKKEEERRKEAEEVAKALEGIKIKIVAKSGKERLYGKVTPKMIVEAIAEQKKVKIDRKKIEFKEDIKKVGSYPVVVKVYPGVEAKITVVVSQTQPSPSASRLSPTNSDEADLPKSSKQTSLSGEQAAKSTKKEKSN